MKADVLMKILWIAKQTKCVHVRMDVSICRYTTTSITIAFFKRCSS